jgi:hypothetical protein
MPPAGAFREDSRSSLAALVDRSAALLWVAILVSFPPLAACGWAPHWLSVWKVRDSKKRTFLRTLDVAGRNYRVFSEVGSGTAATLDFHESRCVPPFRWSAREHVSKPL